MSKTVTQYDLLISCPGDVKSEISLIEKAIEEFNDRYTDTLGITLRVKHWRKNSYAQSGGKPQDLLNEQFVNDCDAAVAIFWTRFGTPTDQYGSGTEEEIQIMLDAGKQVFMYFSKKPLPPDDCDSQEYQRVKNFKEKYKGKGLFFEYSSDEDFEKMFFAHLSEHFLSAKRISEIEEKRASKLLLRGIDENQRLSNNLEITPFLLDNWYNTDEIKYEVIQLFRDIESLNVGKRFTYNGNNSILESTVMLRDRFNTPIEFDEEKIELIKTVSEKLDISISDNFFHLGNLSRNAMNYYPSLINGSGLEMEGTKDEKRKFKLLEELYDRIIEYINSISFENIFGEYNCIRLAIENAGTDIDEDVEITIRVDMNDLLYFDEFPVLSYDIMEFIVKDYGISNVFGISKSVEYNDHDSSMNYQYTTQVSRPFIPVGLGGTDYEEEYQSALSDIYCYDVYPEDTKYVIKLKIDYIKHNTAVSYPAPFLLKNNIDKIDYTITSKKSPNIIEGSIVYK